MTIQTRRRQLGTCRHLDSENASVERRIVVSLSDTMPITRVEVEVFDVLIGRFDQFAANDNEPPPDPQPPAGHGGLALPIKSKMNVADQADH